MIGPKTKRRVKGKHFKKKFTEKEKKLIELAKSIGDSYGIPIQVNVIYANELYTQIKRRVLEHLCDTPDEEISDDDPVLPLLKGTLVRGYVLDEECVYDSLEEDHFRDISNLLPIASGITRLDPTRERNIRVDEVVEKLAWLVDEELN